MKHLNENELREALDLHAAWHTDPGSGRRLELTHVDLKGANLQSAKIYRAILENVDFREANLQGASFHGSEIRSSNFSGSVLDRTDFESTTIEDANFESCMARGIVLANARVSRTSFDRACLENGNLAKSTFRSSSMRATALGTAHLVRWSWQAGSLNGANLSSSDLTGARFRDADLRNVDLTDTVLARTGFSQVHLAGAHGLPLIVDGLGAENLDFSADAHGRAPGNLQTFRAQLGGGLEDSMPWGSATMPKLHQAFHVSDERGRHFSIERRSDQRELIRVEQYERQGEVLAVGYQLMDERLYYPNIPERMIFELVVAGLNGHEYRGKVEEIEYTNLANEYRTYQPYV